MLNEPLPWEQVSAPNPEQDAKAVADVMALQGWASQFTTR